VTSATTRTTPEQLYRLLADNATDVVTLHDLAGHYLYVSPSVQTLGGYEPEDIIGQACWKYMHPDDIAPVQHEMARAVVEGEIVTAEYRWRHAAGHWEWVETTARCVGEEIQCSTRGVGERRAALARQSVVARLGDLVMQRPALETVFDEAVKAVAETLDVEDVRIVEHVEDETGRTSVIVGRHEDPMGVLTVGSDELQESDEGIETDGQLERLVAMGCDHAQGFLLSRPLPAGELEGLL
jgi:PAS domain S-box-containing protein